MGKVETRGPRVSRPGIGVVWIDLNDDIFYISVKGGCLSSLSLRELIYVHERGRIVLR
jgi:hypothetical protein